MGCDIHLYIEYRPKDCTDHPNPLMHRWLSLCGRLNPGRVYTLFAAIAGVRADFGDQIKYRPRGLPTDIGPSAGDDSVVYITEGGDGIHGCSRADAERWVQQGSSVWVKDGKWVTHPDWHSHSWLTFAEFRDAISPIVCGQERAQEYRSVLAAMKQLHDDGHDVRVVFWFDN